MSGSQVVVTRGDVTLRRADIALLKPGRWLNDNLITFWGQLLETEHDPSRRAICFVPPNVGYFLSLVQDDDDVRSAIQGAKVDFAGALLVPINDSVDTAATSASGHHWSLLVWEPRIHAFLYLDSASSKANETVARSLARKLAQFNKDLTNQNTFEVCASPKQPNSSDCGVYCCVFMELFAKHEFTSVKEIENALALENEFRSFRNRLESVITRYA